MSKKVSSNKLRKVVGRFILRVAICFFSFSILSVILLRWLPVRYTPLMFIRYVENIKDGDYRNVREWISIDHISDSVVMAVIAAEDNMFMTHFGIDLEAIKKARIHNRVHGTKLGGSTITQQTAKNVFLLPSRTWSRKAFEAYFTVLMEIFWSKRRIMEVYLNIIETGDGIYGIKAAAAKYFGKSADELSGAEASRIASILPNPRKLEIGKPSMELKIKQKKILNQIRTQIKRPVW
ncbi:MAG: monofunctional biosynthetic peptidoglycan transglycosylase [Prevotellaceae bacterium]|nr:monofunctional biosynthetic peptidoglycan transglycosylase [Prevotellaceae bacterium]